MKRKTSPLSSLFFVERMHRESGKRIIDAQAEALINNHHEREEEVRRRKEKGQNEEEAEEVKKKEVKI